jgi:hypothetical protein
VLQPVTLYAPRGGAFWAGHMLQEDQHSAEHATTWETPRRPCLLQLHIKFLLISGWSHEL